MVGSHSSGSRSTADSYTSTVESSAPPMPSRILKEIEKNELDSQKEMNELKSQIAQLQNLIMKNQDMLNQMILCSQMYMQHFRPPGGDTNGRCYTQRDTSAVPSLPQPRPHQSTQMHTPRADPSTFRPTFIQPPIPPVAPGYLGPPMTPDYGAFMKMLSQWYRPQQQQQRPPWMCPMQPTEQTQTGNTNQTEGSAHESPK